MSYMPAAHLAKFAECKVCDSQDRASRGLAVTSSPYFRVLTQAPVQGRTLQQTGLLRRSPPCLPAPDSAEASR